MSHRLAAAALVLLLASAATLPALGSTAAAAGGSTAGETPAATDATTVTAAASVTTARAPPTDTANASREGETAPDPRIVELLPNPVAAGDAGEYVRVVLPPGNWTVSDGESAVTVSAASGGSAGARPLVLVADPDAAVSLPAGRVVGDGLALSNAGEELALRRGGPDGPVVDRVAYGRAPEGEWWRREGDPQWLPVGLELRDPVALGPANATAFVLPDAPDAAVEPIAAADRRVFLAGYTFASERVARELVAARRRGADVRVLVEGGPVGGIGARQARLLDRLVAAGVDVRVVAGPHARVRYHHPKYAVADGRAVVLTENWKPSGTGGRDNRGWGVVLRSGRAADALAALFRADAGWRDAVPWREFRRGRTFREADEPASGEYPARHPPASVRAEAVTLLTAPGNAETEVASVVDAADERVDVLQPTVADGPLLTSTRRAAERGVRVRLLLSGAWYVVEENEALVARLNRWADRAGVPFEARVAKPGGRFGKVHAKGVVADDVAVVGSLNWNPTSARENREVAVAMRGDGVAGYYRESFEGDWQASRASRGSGDGYGLPPALAVAAVGSVAAALLYARRRFAFDGGGGSEPPGDRIG